MRVVCAATAAVLLMGPARADDLGRRVEDLLAWVAKETGYPLDGVEVTVEFAQPRVLNIVAYGVDYAGQSDVEAIAIGEAILLPDWFAPGRHDDLLVHELTHVLQHTSGAQFTCAAEREREAYETQAAFTDETGIGDRPAPWFLLLMRCDQPWKADLRR
jgi:hypothetical protein